MHRFLIGLIVVFACTLNLASQEQPKQSRISGTVCFPDSSNYPYEVVLKSDSNIIARNFFNKKRFKIEAAVMPTSVEVYSYGFSKAKRSISRSEISQLNDTIFLTHPFILEYNARSLHEVVVTAQEMKIQEDGLNYTISNIQGSDLSDAGTMADMMAWVPGLSLDAAENIQVLGLSGNPLVYIDGTKITDKSKLALLSSHIVKKIEVIRAPGAEYPSGATSVIRITTTKPLKESVNASFIERGTQRNRFSNRLTTNIFGSFGKFDFLASAGYNIGNSKQSSIATESIFSKDESLLREVITSQKDLIHFSRWNWLIGATYHLSDDDEFQIEYSGNTAFRNRNFVSELTTVTNNISELINYDSRNSSTPDKHTLIAAYTHEFANSTLYLTATFNYKKSRSNEDVFLMPEEILNETNEDYSSYNMWTFQGDYSWKLLNKHRQSIGLYGGSSENKSNADYSLMGLQNVNGSVSWGEFYYSSYWNVKGFGITPGVRIRYEKQQSKSFINATKTDYDKSYFNVVPQLSVSHRVAEKFTVNLYYKYDYSLPSFAELSPAITLSDLIYYKTGNPDLKIPRRHNIALAFNLPSLSIVAEYTKQQNKIVETTTPIDNSDYFIVKPVNMAGNYYLTLRANYNLNIANKIRFYATALLRRMHTEYYYLEELQKKNKFFTLISLDASYNIRSNFSVFANVIYASPQLIDNMETGYTCDISFGCNLRLLKSRLSLRLAVDDVLARSVTPYWTSFSPNLYRTRRNHYDTRGVILTATYRFTLAKKEYSKLDNADDYRRL